MAAFAVTFGQQYKREPHPYFGKAHPDGFVVIVAPDWDTARRMAFDNLGQAWSFMYPYDTPEEQATVDGYQPLGELARWTFNPAVTS